MSAGQRRTLIDILQKNDTENTNTGEVDATYSAIYRNVPAKKEDVSGGSTRRGLQVEATVKTVFTIPFVEGISPHWQVQQVNRANDGPVLEIIATLERNDTRAELELHCSDVK